MNEILFKVRKIDPQNKVGTFSKNKYCANIYNLKSSRVMIVLISLMSLHLTTLSIQVEYHVTGLCSTISPSPLLRTALQPV